MNTKRAHIIQSLAILLLVTLLFPIVIQFTHALKKHEYVTSAKKVTFSTEKNTTNCTIFHYQIDHSTIIFSSILNFIKKDIVAEKIYTINSQLLWIKLQHKSSRGPPCCIV